MSDTNDSLAWRMWSPEQIVAALPDLLAVVEARLDEFPEEHRKKNQTAAETLRSDPPTPAQVRDGSRGRDLVTLGFALDVLGRRTARDEGLEASLRLFQAAHELFRGANPLLRAAKPMRQTVGNAVKAIVLHEIGRVRAAETNAGALRERCRAFVTAAWGFLPPQLALGIDELILSELEAVRAAGDPDPGFEERLVQDNLEAVLAMEIPTRLERLRRQWEEIGERVAPTVTRKAQRTVRRAEPLSALLPAPVWAGIQQAVERGDAAALGHVLEEAQDDLEANLRLRLDAKAEYREPASELRLANGVDPVFVEARGLLLRRDPAALDRFNDLRYRRSANTIAKEWYAFALSLFGRATDVHDIIELLEGAIASDQYRPDRGWTARWNLACALRRLPSRASEALDALLPVLDLDAHPAEAFELCLLWALEQERQDVLAGLLLRSRNYEAHLLAALADAQVLGERGGAGATFRDHFRRINRILRDPDRVFPDPRERLMFDELDALGREFVETSMVGAGVEWFCQRLSYGTERHVFKNWECAAALHEAAGDLAAAWRCRQQAWRATQHKRNVDPRRKTSVLRSLLAWAQRFGFHEDGIRILKQCWRDTLMTESDARVWEQRLGGGAPAGGGPEPQPNGTEGDERAGRAGQPPGDAVRSDRWRPPPGSAGSGALPGAHATRTAAAPAATARQPLALMVDWENVKIGLVRLLDEMPEGRAQFLRPRLAGPTLAARLLAAAGRHGWPRQRWVVADWDRPFFEGDQKAVKGAGYWPDIAGGGKGNASDHVLREKIHLVLREHPEIDVYVIATGDGDFHEAIRTLQQHGKQVILWSTRGAISEGYGDRLAGPDAIRIEWLEDLVFEDPAPTDRS